MSMEGRLTLCNLSIEMGARGGFIAPDETTFAYLKGREFSPKGEAWDEAVKYWKTLRSDDDAMYDKELVFSANQESLMEPILVWESVSQKVYHHLSLLTNQVGQVS